MEAGIEAGRFLPLEPGQQWDRPGPNQPPHASERLTTMELTHAVRFIITLDTFGSSSVP